MVDADNSVEVERAEDIFVVGFVRQEADAVERLGAGRDDEVDEQQQDRGDDRRAARPLIGVLGLLVDAHGGVPAPIDEDSEQDSVD